MKMLKPTKRSHHGYTVVFRYEDGSTAIARAEHTPISFFHTARAARKFRDDLHQNGLSKGIVVPAELTLRVLPR
jgi:hypothetical protein